MGVPTFLGQIGSARDDSGGVTSLDLVVARDVPPGTHTRVLFFVVTTPLASLSMSDNQPDPGGTGQPGNAYGPAANGVGGRMIYAEGFPQTIITAGQNLFVPEPSGFTGVYLPTAACYWGLSAGTTITLAIFGGPVDYASIVGYAFARSEIDDHAVFVSGTIDPANTEVGIGSPTAMSTVTFADAIAGIPPAVLAAIVCTDATHGDISCPSGIWTPLDSDTSVAGATWATFLVNGEHVDPAEQLVQFTTSIDGVAILDRRVGVNVYALPLWDAPVGNPAFNRLIPV